MNYNKSITKELPFDYTSDYEGRKNDNYFNDHAINRDVGFEFSNDFVIEVAPHAEIPAAYLHDVSVGFMDFTAQANEDTPNDVELIPNPVAVNDAFYFGSGTTFSSMWINLTTQGTGTFTIAWEYFNGAWQPLTFLWKNYASAQTLTYRLAPQWIKHDWIKPGDWQETIINGLNAYWIRSRVSAAGLTIQPLAGRLYISDFSLVLAGGKKSFANPFSVRPAFLPPAPDFRLQNKRMELPELRRLSYDYRTYAAESNDDYSDWFMFPFESYFIHFQSDADTVLQFMYREGGISEEIAGNYMYRTLNVTGFRIKNYFRGFNAKYQLVAFR